MTKDLIFTDWEERSSNLGLIMTNLDGITTLKLKKLIELQNRKLDHLEGKAKALTHNMEVEMSELIKLRDKKDELPTGAITHLDDVFRDFFWKRKRFLNNKYLEKGNLQEQDAIAILRKYIELTSEKIYLEKNGFWKSNGFTNGTEDVVTTNFVFDTKCSYDLESFENSELTNAYKWQVKDYCWRNNKTKGFVAFCLVNNPLHHLINERERLYFINGKPNEDDDSWIEILKQLERNMIFDIPKFIEENPEYTFVNVDLDFTIPLHLRVKLFPVDLEEKDIENIKSRVLLAREYLVEKETKTLSEFNKYNDFISDFNNKLTE